MPFSPQASPFHELFGYNHPHLPYGTEPVTEEVPPVFEWDVEESGDEHEFSETVDVEHEPTDAVGDENEPSTSPDEGDIVGYEPVVDPEAAAEDRAELAEEATETNDYKDDEPEAE